MCVHGYMTRNKDVYFGIPVVPQPPENTVSVEGDPVEENILMVYTVFSDESRSLFV